MSVVPIATILDLLSSKDKRITELEVELEILKTSIKLYTQRLSDYLDEIRKLSGELEVLTQELNTRNIELSFARSILKQDYESKDRETVVIIPEGMRPYSVSILCEATLFFRNDQEAFEAINSSGSGSIQTVVDSSGKTVENVDTFYGIRSINPAKFIENQTNRTVE
jgi:hypothetical protein